MKAIRSLIASLVIMLLAFTMCISAFAYTDVDANNKNLAKIEFIDDLGIVPRSWTGDFSPDAYFTRANAVIAVYRMLHGTNIDPSVYDTEDLGFIIDDSKEGVGDIESDSMLAAYLTWAVDNYLVTTNVENSVFKPQEPITANEFMTLIAKILRLVESTNASYPDDYTSAVSNLVGDIKAGEEPVTREQAAVALANALVAQRDGTAGELGVYVDTDGAPLDSLAVNVFNMSSVDLVIRATKNNSLGYTVENGTLLSNGADVDLGEDLSDYVGYGINITYCDKDGSKTLTEDEEILAHSVRSTNSATVSADMVTITSGNSISIDSDAGSFNIGTSTFMYLNGEPWPIGDSDYDLVKLIPAIGHTATISNRPNMIFKCMQAGESTTLATVFVTETRPGKVMGINNGYYSIYDYYKSGKPDEIKVFNVSDCTFAGTVKVGDYVNFYVTNGKCHIAPGTTVESAIIAKETAPDSPTDYILADGNTIKEHAFFHYGNTALDIKEDGSGSKYIFVLADADQGYMLTWETKRVNYTPMIIEDITTDRLTSTHTITATNLSTAKQVTFTADFANTDSVTALGVGDYIDCSDNGAADEADRIIYVQKAASVTLNVRDYGDYFMDTASGDIYYKNQRYSGNKGSASDFTVGTATLNLDMAKTVVSIIAD